MYVSSMKGFDACVINEGVRCVSSMKGSMYVSSMKGFDVCVINEGFDVCVINEGFDVCVINEGFDGGVDCIYKERGP